MGMFVSREAFARKLDALFAAEPGVSNERVDDMSGYIGSTCTAMSPATTLPTCTCGLASPENHRNVCGVVADALPQRL